MDGAMLGDAAMRRRFWDADELAALQRLYREAAAGRPRLVVVEGPAGIGKTALVRHFLAGTVRGCVLSAVGEENESDLPYGVLSQLLGRAVRTDPLTAGAELLEDGTRHPNAVAPAVTECIGPFARAGAVSLSCCITSNRPRLC